MEYTTKRNPCTECPWKAKNKEAWNNNIMNGIKHNELPNALHKCHKIDEENQFENPDNSNVCIGSLERYKEMITN